MGGEGVWVGSRPPPSPWTIKVILYLHMGYTLLVWATVACIGEGGVWVMLVDGSDMSDKNTYLPYLAIPSPLIGRRRATRPRTHVRSGIKQT